MHKVSTMLTNSRWRTWWKLTSWQLSKRSRQRRSITLFNSHLSNHIFSTSNETSWLENWTRGWERKRLTRRYPFSYRLWLSPSLCLLNLSWHKQDQKVSVFIQCLPNSPVSPECRRWTHLERQTRMVWSPRKPLRLQNSFSKGENSPKVKMCPSSRTSWLESKRILETPCLVSKSKTCNIPTLPACCGV